MYLCIRLYVSVARKCQVYAVLFVEEYFNYLPLASQVT